MRTTTGVPVHRALGLCVTVMIAAGACSSSDSTAPALQHPTNGAENSILATASAALAGFPIDLSAHSHSCRSQQQRAFDFWLGNWDARTTGTGVLSGTDSIASRLDGCAIEERWTDGGRGRSLSAYDQDLGQWTQFWVYSGGGPFTPLLLQGNVVNGQMRMRYDRTSANGVPLPFAPSVLLFAASDDYTWSSEAGGQSLIQRDVTAFNGGPASLSFELRYSRVASVTPIPVSSASVCQTRPQNHQFDFMLGRWNIYSTGILRGVSLGSTTFSADLGDCLMEEHFDAPGSYDGWSFNSYNLFTEQWHRTYVDNLGHRLAFAGGLQNGDMVLTATQPTVFGKALIRVTWHPVSPGEVRETWDASLNGGASWPLRSAFTFVRQ